MTTNTSTMPKFGLGSAYTRLTGTNPTISWAKLRKAVFARDGGICKVCGREVVWGKNYECGHIVDRCAGGKDEMENLVSQCYICNRTKPVHDTREEYEAWVAEGGGFKAVWKEALRRTAITDPEFVALLEAQQEESVK